MERKKEEKQGSVLFVRACGPTLTQQRRLGPRSMPSVTSQGAHSHLNSVRSLHRMHDSFLCGHSCHLRMASVDRTFACLLCLFTLFQLQRARTDGGAAACAVAIAVAAQLE